MKWKINPDDEQEVITNEPGADAYWSICDVCNGLPGDDEGILAAEQIVANHNAMLTVAPRLLAAMEHMLDCDGDLDAMDFDEYRNAVEAAQDTMRGTP
jgi:hypothetical protein